MDFVSDSGSSMFMLLFTYSQHASEDPGSNLSLDFAS